MIISLLQPYLCCFTQPPPGASRKFRDTLAGRKAELWLTPMMSVDLADFGASGLKHRLLRGGLPPFFLAASFPERDFQEWMDAYWAKDSQSGPCRLLTWSLTWSSMKA